MTLVNVIAIIIIILSLIGGLREGAVKHFFSLLALFIAIPLAGLFYRLIAIILSFLPGDNWENFIGFFIALCIASIILHLVFLIPAKITRAIWKKGCLVSLLGGALNLFNATIGMTVFTLALRTYPIISWLERAVTNAGIPTWLVEHFGFVAAMLPEVFR
ncbi:CvpA family protein [Chloroflexota bacterium]